MADTVFSKILAGNTPASFIYRDDHVAAFLDVHPVNEGHALVIPVTPAASLAELDADTGSKMFALAHRIARSYLAGAVACEGVNLWLSDGKVAGQEVMHVHIHVVPRRTGDSLTFRYDHQPWDEARRETYERLAAHICSRL